MLFNSFSFLVLLILTFGLYYVPAIRKRWQVHLLVLSSFVFYAWEAPVLLSLLLFSITINAFTSYRVFFGQPAQRKFYAALGVVINLAVLAFFKYSPLFGRSLFPDSSDVGRFLISIPLPIGISFFTFHGISLLVDVYCGKRIEEYQHLIARSFGTHWLTTSLYIAFFPQLIAGPIVKSYGFLPQIREKYFKDIRWNLAFEQLVIGYFLKMVVADNLKDQTFWIRLPHFESLDSLTLVSLLFGYSMQIFADFAGYSLIALGLAELFGYQLPENFRFPYISRSFAEFWKRWHISLSSWLQEYLYIGALGGNRKGKIRTYVNLFITMFLGGLWHGAAWSYAVWGSFHGLALAIERLPGKRFRLPDNKLVAALQMLIVFGFVTLAWLLFKLPDFSQAMKYLQAIGANKGKRDLSIIFFTALYSLPVVLFHLDHLWRPAEARGVAFRRWQPLVYALLLFLLFTNSGSAGDFIYFQF